MWLRFKKEKIQVCCACLGMPDLDKIVWLCQYGYKIIIIIIITTTKYKEIKKY